MRGNGFAPSGRNATLVRVTSYENKCLRGTVSGPGLERPVGFGSAVCLMLLMEELMDRRGFPQRGEEHRAFRPARPLPAAAREEGSPLAQFQVSVLFRQNASWQGSLAWLDRGLEAQFRSVLELMCLMDNALAENGVRA